MATGLAADDLEVFSTEKTRDGEMAISIYFGAATKGTTHSNPDITFTQYLKSLWTRTQGWWDDILAGCEGSLYLNAARFKARGSQSQPDKSAGDESEGDKSKGDDTEEVEEEGDEDESEDHGEEEEEDETSLPPPPTKVLESTAKQVGKATPLPLHTAQLRS